jgi:hypothetical protein
MRNALAALSADASVGKCLDGTDYCFPAFARSVKGGFPPAEDPNVSPTLPLFALHASLLIPCSPRHYLSWIGATDGCFQRTEVRGRGRACSSPLPFFGNLASLGAREALIGKRADSGEWYGRTVLSDRMSARSFLPFQPGVQVRCAETPQFTDMGTVDLPASSQLL